MKVLLGFSGGVDSSIAAYKLKEAGYEVTGAFMRNWDSFANGDFLGNPTIHNDQCPQEADYDDAVAVAKKLGIPLLRVDFVKEYWDSVFTYFLEEYKKGRTPNPDVLCNKNIKFDSFLKFAKDNGFDCIAMGHYAKRRQFEGHDYLYKPLDKAKDQTYFLCQINEEQIASCLFPMEDITKVESREIARKLGLSEVADKHGSTGVCFIGERNFRQFLMNYFPAQDGDIIDIETGKKVGRHVGVLYYTLGQRKGLGIGGIKNGPTKPWFVCKKDVKNNVLYVASGDEDEHLNSDASVITDINWIGPKPGEPIHVGVKFRYRQQDCPCTLEWDGDTIRLTHDEPYKAVTPGQYAVFYTLDEGRMLGGGIIDQTYYKGKRVDK